ncbi:MAG: hypothetical protein ACRDY7_18225 [Acidimicrobiia bacterium]
MPAADDLGLADAVNEIRLSGSGDADLVSAYAETVVDYSHLVRPELSDDRHGPAQLAIVDHLVERLRPSQNHEITTPVLEIVDRLHGELTRQPATI